jgi:hypothetical protein
MTSREAMAWAFDSVTLGGAAAMGLPDPTLRVGGPATMVVLQARDPIEAIRLKADAPCRDPGGAGAVPDPGARGGTLSLDGRPDTLDPADYAPPAPDTPKQPTTKGRCHDLQHHPPHADDGGRRHAGAARLYPPGQRQDRAARRGRACKPRGKRVEQPHPSRHAGGRRGRLIEYEFSEGVAATDYPRAMREYAESRAQLIWGESYAVEREAREVAADYPETAFLMGSSGGPEGDNFGVFGTRNHEAAYLAGMLAGTMSESNVFGSVGGFPIPEVNLLINAFRMGVSEVNPDATFLNGFIGAWFDPARAQEMAIAQIDQGADILFGERIGTADGAEARGVKAIGSLIDYTPRYPETVFANAIWNYGPTIAAIVADVQAGNPVGRDYTEYSFMEATAATS